MPRPTAPLLLPAEIGDYTDFYARHPPRDQCRPAVPARQSAAAQLQIGADRLSWPRLVDRASAARQFRRPNGQRKRGAETVPASGPAALDYEMELGVCVGPGNALGQPIPIDGRGDHIVGFCLLNDWSARDIQAWEYQPLGPFLAKNFATTISPWVVTPEALAPYRSPPARGRGRSAAARVFARRDGPARGSAGCGTRGAALDRGPAESGTAAASALARARP